MSKYLGRIAMIGLTVGVLSLALAYAMGGRDLGRLFDRGIFVAQSCSDGATKTGATTERDLAWTGDALDIALPATVRFQGGEGADIVVRGSPDAIANVELRDGRLTLNCRWTAASRDIEVSLPGRSLRRLGISGSAKVVMDKLSQPELALRISGSGSLRAQGAVDRLMLVISGSGNARLGDVVLKQLTVKISGSGNVEAAPTDEADIKVSGSGNVRLLTQPARLRSHIAGSGHITQVPLEAAESGK
jgi:hypothetical protein